MTVLIVAALIWLVCIPAGTVGLRVAATTKGRMPAGNSTVSLFHNICETRQRTPLRTLRSEMDRRGSRISPSSHRT